MDQQNLSHIRESDEDTNDSSPRLIICEDQLSPIAGSSKDTPQMALVEAVTSVVDFPTSSREDCETVSEKGGSFARELKTERRSDANDSRCSPEENRSQFTSKILTGLSDPSKSHNKHPFRCEECSNVFVNKGNLKRHMRVHTGIRPFTCPTCEKTFTAKDTLKTHMRKHTGEKPYICPECPASFIESKRLKRHILNLHITIETFHCSECEFTHRSLDMFKKHLESNQTHKFKCHKCSYNCDINSELRKHMVDHVLPCAFSCQICNASFPTNVKLAKHKKTHFIEKRFNKIISKK